MKRSLGTRRSRDLHYYNNVRVRIRDQPRAKQLQKSLTMREENIPVHIYL